MQKKINKISIALSIALVFLGMMGFGQTTLDPTKKSIQAWIHPSYNETGSHACDATGEYQDGRTINVLKPEYLHVYSGVLQLYPFSLVGCNGYNENNASDVLNLQFNTVTRPGYITVSGSHLSLKMLLEDQNKKNALKNAIVNYMTYNPAMPNLSKFEGVELDFENPSISDVKPFGPKLWNSDVPSSVSCWGSYQKYWSSYFQLINLIGDALHTMPTPKKLMIDCPEMSVDDPGCWDYGFFKNNPNVDYICVLAYDYMYSFPDQAVAPTNWVSNIVDYVISKMGGNSNNDVNMNKIIIGMPSYGYTLVNNEVVLKQQHDALAQTGYYNITDNFRDADSYERYFVKNNIKWYYQDGIGMSAKIEKIRAKGIKHVSVWSLGGNLWFNKMEDNSYIQANDISSSGWTTPSNALNYPSAGDNTTTSPTATGNSITFNVVLSTPPSGSSLAGIEVAIIGHSTIDDNTGSKITVEVSGNNGTSWNTVSTDSYFLIYSHHDVIKLIGSPTNNWGLSAIQSNNFKVRLTYNSGPVPSINAVFVKPYYTTCQNTGNEYHTQSGEVWSDGKIVNDWRIYVDYGKELTVNGNVFMAPGSQIIVNIGGKLTIENATLTCICPNSTWNGILVKGNADYPQSNTYHGEVELSNSTIKNANIGIMTWSYEKLTGGGIITAKESNFINNRISVFMLAQTSRFKDANNQYITIENINYFRNCNFINNCDNSANLWGLYLTEFGNFANGMVNIWGVDGVVFKSCKFTNTSTGNLSNAGVGIKIAGKFTLRTSSGSYASEFNNLNYGIESYNSDNSSIKDAIFNNNIRGVYLDGNTNSTITGNTFYVKNINPLSSAVIDMPYGVYLNNSTGYTFTGNTFNKAVANNGANGKFGLIINNSGSVANMIYNNIFKYLDYGTNAQGNNRNSNISGLQIKCNDYSHTAISNISVTDAALGEGISEYQGYNGTDITSPAGNTFSTTAYHINNSGDFVTYYHHLPSTTYKVYPDNVSTLVGRYNTQKIYIDKSTVCPTNSTSVIINPWNGLTALNTKDQLINSAQLMYDIWVDGGNTQALLDAVNLSYPWEAFELYNNLISKSPYLSDEVLIKAIENEDGLPALMLKYVLLANPQAVRSSKVMDALYKRNNPFPEEWIDELKQGPEVVSPREQLEAQIAYYTQERQLVFNELKNLYREDTTGYYTQDSIIELLRKDIEPVSYYQLASYYLNIKEDRMFQDIMDSIAIKFNYTEEQMLAHQDYADYFEITKYLRDNNNDYAKLSEEQKNKLYQLAEHDRNYTSAYARFLLKLIDTNFVYQEPIYLPDENNKLKMSRPIKQLKQENNLLKVFPNPATDYFIVEYNITDAVKGASLEVVDMMNRKVESITIKTAKGQRLIQTKAIAKGIYHCYLINNAKIIKQTKITVE